MREYLLLFWNTTGDGQYQMDAEKMKAAMDAWQAWIGNIAMQGKLVTTKPINWEGTQIRKSGQTNTPVILNDYMVTGYLICKSANLEEVIGWSNTCPILANPNGFTEIREIMPFNL